MAAIGHSERGRGAGKAATWFTLSLLAVSELLIEFQISQAASFGAEHGTAAVKNELPGTANKSVTL